MSHPSSAEFIPVNIAVLTVSDSRTPLSKTLQRQLDSRSRPCNVVDLFPKIQQQ